MNTPNMQSLRDQEEMCHQYGKIRTLYQPRHPHVLGLPDAKCATLNVSDGSSVSPSQDGIHSIPIGSTESPCYCIRKLDDHEVRQHQDICIGIVVCGHPTPGINNVIWGIQSSLASSSSSSSAAAASEVSSSRIIGFRDGIAGLLNCQTIEINEMCVMDHRNSGGNQMLGRIDDSKDSLDKQEIQSIHDNCKKLKLNSLVVVGDACALSISQQLVVHASVSNVSILYIPADYTNSLANPFNPICLGFHSYTHSMSALVANTCTDSASAAKYYHFISLLNHSKSSQVVMECSLQTHPTYSILNESFAQGRTSFSQLIRELTEVVVNRHVNKCNYGVVLFASNLCDSIVELTSLAQELFNLKVAQIHPTSRPFADIVSESNGFDRSLFLQLPPLTRSELISMVSRAESVEDMHLSSSIYTAHMLGQLVQQSLKSYVQQGIFKGKMEYQTHNFGTQFRNGFPSKFDCDLGFSLGQLAVVAARGGLHGYACSVVHTHHHVEEWIPICIPFDRLHHEIDDSDHGTVDLNSKLFSAFSQQFLNTEFYCPNQFINPGPIQYEGVTSECKPMSVTPEFALDKILDVSGEKRSLNHSMGLFNMPQREDAIVVDNSASCI